MLYRISNTSSPSDAVLTVPTTRIFPSPSMPIPQACSFSPKSVCTMPPEPNDGSRPVTAPVNWLDWASRCGPTSGAVISSTLVSSTLVSSAMREEIVERDSFACSVMTDALCKV